MLTMDDRDFQRIVGFVRDNYGIDLSKKQALVQGRLGLDIERRGYTSFSAYFDQVTAHPHGAECQHMIDKLSTNHTFFFREPDCLTHMRDIAIPALLARGETDIRIWCAAASTGQECYSIAMMMEEALALRKGAGYHILGSDINSQVLAAAKEGVYPLSQLDGIPARFHKRFCRPIDAGSFGIAQVLKERITWRRINLVKPLQFIEPQHLIFCRNVMIYFEPAAKETLTAELHRIVCDGGFVYVGNTETLDMKRTRFEYMGPSVFAKRKAVP